MQLSATDVLFVYGTLRRGCRNHKVLRRVRGQFLGEGSVRGALYDFGEFPGAICGGTGEGKVWGEIYRFKNPRRAFKMLDKLESFDAARPEGGQFMRRTATVTLSSGRRLQAWVYWLNDVGGARRRLPSGNYCRRGS